MKHYHVIVMSGSFGCLPDWLSWGPNERDAVEQATEVHDLSTRQAKALRKEEASHGA